MKTAVITGSSRGLGREIALRFARAGWNLVLNSVRSTEQLEQAAHEINGIGARAVTIAGDVTDETVRRKLIDSALDSFGALHCLVNNAGVTDRARFTALDDADRERVMAVDLFAPAALARLAAKQMPAGASIVNIASICGLWGCKGAVAYSAAKGALAGSTAALASELKPIRVNAVAPGYMQTRMGLDSTAGMELAASQHPMHRLADPAGAAEFIFQLHDIASINGQLIVLDGRIR